MIPTWLHGLAILSLTTGALLAAGIAVDVTRQPQAMGVMNAVWPLTALYGGVPALWLYLRFGRRAGRGEHSPPFAASVAKGAAHCGAGCTLGDLIAEWLAFLYPGVAVCFGWHSLFADKMFAVWVVDFIFAFTLGIVFQYFAIAPMRGLGPRAGIVAALQADTLSLAAWQTGMYGCMAAAQFVLFGPLLHVRLEPDMVEFWFAMQIAMIAGFVTAYPVNWWLIRGGIKERM